MTSAQFLMVNPLYDMSASFTDASTNIDYQANASRNFINLIGDISNVDVSNTLYEGKTYDPSLSLVQFVKKTKRNFLDSNVNTMLDNLLYWARNTSGPNKFPILETGASGESNNEQPIELPTLSMIARYNFTSWVNNTTWNDMTGNNKHMVNVEAGTSQFITAENANMTQNNGRAFPYIKGNWNSRWNVYDSSTTFTDYTLVFITRYDPDGNPSDYSHITHHQWGRILDAQWGNNTYWGHAWKNAHQVHRNNQDMKDANGQTADQLYGSTPSPTFEWCFGICTPQSFICRGSDKLTEWHVADQVIGSHGTPRVTIRNGMFTGECAHWHIAELIMYDRIVTNDEIDTIKAWIEENFILTDN